MGYHTVHCPWCGRVFDASELAFDFGELIKRDLEVLKNLEVAPSDEWFELVRFELCLYYTKEDLEKIYKIKPQGDKIEGWFIFTVEQLKNRILELAQNEFCTEECTIEKLADNPEDEHYEYLYPKMKGSGSATSGAITKEDISNLCKKIISKKGDEVISKFKVEVIMSEDDQGNRFANRLKIKNRKGEIINVFDFVCKGTNDKPCGKTLYGHAGKFEEKIIGMVGTARVGKTAYLVSLIASIDRRGNGVEILGHQQDVINLMLYNDPRYENFIKDLVNPYIGFQKIKKTEKEMEKESEKAATIPLFSVTFCIKDGKTKDGKNYIFTFVDIPGEVYQEGNANVLSNRRAILKYADAFLTCVAPKQIDPNGIRTIEQQEIDLSNVFPNINKVIEAVSEGREVPTALLITCSDQIARNKGLFDSEFNPFESDDNPMTETGGKNPWIDSRGRLIVNNMEDFIKKANNYLKSTPQGSKIPGSIGKYVPFAVASYGGELKNEERNEMDDFLGTRKDEKELSFPHPSMIECPFIWLLARLGILPAVEIREEAQEFTEVISKGFMGIGKKVKKEIRYVPHEYNLSCEELDETLQKYI